MRLTLTIRHEYIATAKAWSILLLLLSVISLKAQTPTNHSGRWEFYKTKSSPEEVESTYDGTVILEITQNSATITLGDIYIHPGRPDWKTATELYTLDGKE
jgi:hypothetical protein